MSRKPADVEYRDFSAMMVYDETGSIQAAMDNISRHRSTFYSLQTRHTNRMEVEKGYADRFNEFKKRYL